MQQAKVLENDGLVKSLEIVDLSLYPVVYILDGGQVVVYCYFKNDNHFSEIKFPTYISLRYSILPGVKLQLTGTKSHFGYLD